ncbi:aromatic prenyltransferase [Streptomyces sp. NPDC059639]|uniref:aromatic prenyltransferase n=1 Tax=Streptomyces sp. NPDC059639 TaxID=3346891 RepID=UPI0036C663F9
MSGATAAEDVYATIEESARLLGVPCSRERIQPILTAYGKGLADAGMVLSVATGSNPTDDLDYTITVPAGKGPDPYAVALAEGFVTESDHPVAGLLEGLKAHTPINEYFIDGGIVSGFSKVYAHFPDNMLTVAQLAAITSMPPSLADNADLFARHHMDTVAMIGINYRSRTVNLYFAHLPDAFRTEENIRSLNRDLGLSEPQGQALEFAQRSFRSYVTLGWESSRIEKICYAPAPVRDWDPSALPVPLDPRIEKFVRNTRCAYSDRPFVIAALKWSPAGQHLNLGPYIRLSPLLRNLLHEVTGERV